LNNIELIDLRAGTSYPFGTFALPYSLESELCFTNIALDFSCEGEGCSSYQKAYVTEQISTNHYQIFFNGLYNEGCNEVTNTVNLSSDAVMGTPITTYETYGFSGASYTKFDVTWHLQPDSNLLSQCYKTGSNSQFHGVVYDENTKNIIDTFSFNIDFP
jgi:hypothetical protein